MIICTRSQPLVSILMPSLNQAEFIVASVQSVLSQSYHHLELIVSDGGSTDGTQALLLRLQANDSRLRWYSEPDAGPADALNNSLRLGRGTIIGWLNSDDIYITGAVDRAIQALHDKPDWLMVYGHGEHIDAVGQVLRRYPTLAPPIEISQFAKGCFICQPTVFFRRSMSVLLGPLNQSLQTAFDLDYWMRAFKAFPSRIGFVDAVQAQSRLHADCITLRLRRTVFLEGMQLLAQHLGHAPKEWFLSYVAEQIAKPPSEYSADTVKANIAQLLSDARPWLHPADFESLKMEFG